MRHKKHVGSNRHARSGGGGGRGKFRSSGNEAQSLARQKKHAMTQKEKFLGLARDAQSSGERVDAEYYYQHVEHYSRVIGEILLKEGQAEERKAEQREADGNAPDGSTAEEDAPKSDVQVEKENGETGEALSTGESQPEADQAEAKPKSRARKRATADKSKSAQGGKSKENNAKDKRSREKEIPLPASVIPEPEPAPADPLAASAN